MQVSSINVSPSQKQGSSNFIGWGYVELNGELSISIQIMRSPKNGNIFVAWPANSWTDGQGNKKYSDLVVWRDKQNRSDVEDQILREYNRVVGISTTSPRTQQQPAHEPAVTTDDAPAPDKPKSTRWRVRKDA